ncbi:MAG: cytochrome C [Bacteroidetes bacterium]|nr:MAG: cytochrome C [Bacteroidota bacterium]
MAQIFPRKANLVPTISLIAGLGGGVFVVLFIWYYFSPEFTDVGYSPEQPIEFSHRFHNGELGLDCQYCHTNVKVASHSNVPSTQTCMNCHSQIKKDSEKLLPLRTSFDSGESVKWLKVHHLPDYAQFSHAIHTNNGIGCETCHGRVDRMEVLTQSKSLAMGWCIDCHREPEKYLRPDSEVTTMGYTQPTDFLQRNLERIRRESIKPPTNCSACHY